MARGPPKLCQISRKSATKGWGWGQRPSIFLVWICCLLRRGWGLAWAPYSHRAPRFLVWHVTQVNIWLERILDSCTTHFDQVLPNKYSWNAKKYGIFYYYGALGWMWSIQLPQNMFCKIFFSYRAFYIYIWFHRLTVVLQWFIRMWKKVNWIFLVGGNQWYPRGPCEISVDLVRSQFVRYQ